MGGELSQRLLTDDDRRAYLHELLGHRFKAHEQIQLPTLDQYNSLGTDAGLQTVGYELCRQLGFKPNGLSIRYSEAPIQSGYTVNHKDKTILINPGLADHPHSSGAELALAITAYTIEHFGKEAPGRPLTEFATVEVGLGLWVINALRPRISFRQKLYHLIDTSWFTKEGIQLEAFSPRQYVERFVSFTHENRIAADIYLPHVIRGVRYLFPEFIQSQSGRYLPEAAAVLHHKRSANLLWVKILLVGLILANGIVLGIYILTTKQNSINPEVVHQEQVVRELKESHTECLEKAADQQNKYDPNDLFMTRQIDDTKTRCESLRNQYNYAVDQYNALR